MITVKNIYKSFIRQTLFEDANLQINDGERFALVGPNGSGKSTLFKMLLGESDIDEGEIILKKGIRVGYLPQENAPVSDKGVIDSSLEGIESYDSRAEAKAKAILMGLGFKADDFKRQVNTLSGGWAMRAAMANLLVKEPDLVLLDEPTNHLDFDSLMWLREYLLNYPGAIFFISHDRDFINRISNAVVAVEEKKLKVYKGDYENYLFQKGEEAKRLRAAWKRQRDEIKHMEDFIARNRVRASTAARAQSMIKRLEKMERIKLPEETKKVKIHFPQPKRSGVRCLTLKNVSKTYDIKGGKKIKVYENLDFEIERGQRMAFIGHNGAGKSTLLKILAGEISIDKGERILGINVKSGYFSQHRAETLNPERTVLQEAMDNGRMNPELLVRTILGAFLFHGDDVFKKTKVLSGGEKSRLALAKILLDPPNILLMDEPTTHLDMQSVNALIEALKDYEGALCFISHDLYFINTLANNIVHIDGGTLSVYPGNYDYFAYRQKQKALEDSERTVAPAKVVLPKEPTKKDERKKRAEEREKNKFKKQLKKGLEKHKKEIENLALRLSNPEIHSDYKQVRHLGNEIERIKILISEKESELLED